MENNLDNKQIAAISPLALAYVGDAVFSLMVRQKLVYQHDFSEGKLTKLCSKIVNAGSQCSLFRKWQPLLSKEEQNIARRARNSNIHSRAKNYSVEEYIYATALEAVVGYLYLSGQTERLESLMEFALEEI